MVEIHNNRISIVGPLLYLRLFQKHDRQNAAIYKILNKDFREPE